MTEALCQTLARHSIDVAFLPVNGRDEIRRQQGIVGNMTAAEAVSLSIAQHFGLLVPTHFDLFTNNSIPVSEFLDQVQQQRPVVKYRIFQPGEEWLLRQA